MLPVTLWVFGKKLQAEALIDSGASTNFIDKSFVQSNNLVTYKIANPYPVYNADETANKDGKITEYIRAYVQIGGHKSTHQLFVTNLGNKQMILGMTYLRKHNPEIDWRKGEWQYTRCPESCAQWARKTSQPSREEANELEGQYKDQMYTPLDEIGEECAENPYINWVHINDPVDQQICSNVAAILEKDIEEDDQDTRYWKTYVPEQYYEYEDVFSKTKSERMPVHKPYDHGIDFVEDAILPRLAKIYPMSPAERNSLDEWITEQSAKGYIRESKSPVAASVFFVKKKDGTLRLVKDYRKLNAITKKN